MSFSNKTATKTTTETTTTTTPSGERRVTTTTKTTYSDGSSSTQTRTQTESASGNDNRSNCDNVNDNRNVVQNQMPRAASSGFGAFETEALRAHNTYRANHGAAPLVLSQELCSVAQDWANHLAQTGILEHGKTRHGENLFWTCGNNVPSGATAVDDWYSEVKDHTWIGGWIGGDTGHFTQVVWKGTKELGIAQSRGRNGVYVVANYNPPGNVNGGYKDNVGPKK
ncbi:hypothetical protein BV898_05988 [Hypsibius exemplaris]|uniref:SCP domain-containing protein n=1 Tax=Hypsibius exemplaris TaxID=2072580 RepID=A0A1W0WXQ0_HYPEX|nr:hypothetical protein BV898_05988 [Hypsibius exemplaris]